LKTERTVPGRRLLSKKSCTILVKDAAGSKPDSVTLLYYKVKRRPFIWNDGCPSLLATYPGTWNGQFSWRSPIWSCSEWGLPCQGCHHPCGALLPHHFTLTVIHGGIFSVALSL